MQLYGKGGVILIVLLVFMAVTSSGSAEFLAVSSLVSYDIYGTYINPNAGGKKVWFAARCACVPKEYFHVVQNLCWEA